MAFSPRFFLSNIDKNQGLAKPSRFRLLLPIPNYLKNFIESSLLDQAIDAAIQGQINIFIASLFRESTPFDNLDTASISRTLALQCEATEMPGKSLQTVDAKIYGPTFKVPYQSQYNEISFTFICTNGNFFERKLFERWIESIMPTDTNNLRFAKGRDGGYLTNPKIVQYDDYAKEIHVVELVDAFPISIAPQALSWSEDGFHRLSVQFTYQRYRTIYRETFETLPPEASL